jgi:hypothetical protein
MNLAARMQLALGTRSAPAETRRGAARDRILRMGFWLPPEPHEHSAEILQLHPGVATRRAPL